MADKLKSAVELAMERLRKKDAQSRESAPRRLTAGQKERIAEIRREYKANVISQRLRDIGGEPEQIRIKNKPTRVWSIPAYNVVEVEVSTPDFGDTSEAPF